MLSLLTRFGANAPALSAGLLPTPAPLPSLTTAFSRRAALFGTVASTGALAGSAVRAVSDLGMSRTAVADADRRLTAMAADICATLDGAAYAFDPVHDEADQDRRIDRANRLTLGMVALPAVGLAGVLAKAKAYLDSCSYDVHELADLSQSLAEDVERVLGGAA